MNKLSNEQMSDLYNLAVNGTSFEEAKKKVIPKANGKRGRKSLIEYKILQEYVNRSQEMLNGEKINPSKLANKVYELLVKELTEVSVFPSVAQIGNLLRHNKLSWNNPVAESSSVKMIVCPPVELSLVETMPDGAAVMTPLLDQSAATEILADVKKKNHNKKAKI